MKIIMLKNRKEASVFVIKVGDLYLENQFVSDRVVLTNTRELAFPFFEGERELAETIYGKIKLMEAHGLKDIKVVKVVMVNEAYEHEYRFEKRPKIQEDEHDDL